MTANVPAWQSKLTKDLLLHRKRYARSASEKGLDLHFDAIAALAKVGVDLKLKKAKQKDLSPGVSRIGGEPDLPAHFAWPMDGANPLAWIAQLSVPDAAHFDFEGVLPDGGWLTFFAQVDETKPGFGERCAVFHLPKGSALQRTPPPVPEAAPIPEVGLLLPKPRLTLPPTLGPKVSALGLDADQLEDYENSLFRGPIPEGRHHQLLGWPSRSNPLDAEGLTLLAELDSDYHLKFKVAQYASLRFYISGSAVNAATLKTARCTIAYSNGT